MNLPREAHMQNMPSLQESAIVYDLIQHPQTHLHKNNVFLIKNITKVVILHDHLM